MKIPRSIRYFATIDILDAANMHEASVYLEQGLDPNISLPVDAGIKGAAEIYGVRSGAIFKATGAMALRVTGMDALARVITDTEFPH